MPRYLTEFRWVLPSVGLTEWSTAECPVPTSMTEVVAVISGHSDQSRGLVHVPRDKLGTIRVTQIDMDGSTPRDVTEDALLALGQAALDRGDDWPFWCEELAPSYGAAA